MKLFLYLLFSKSLHNFNQTRNEVVRTKEIGN